MPSPCFCSPVMVRVRLPHVAYKFVFEFVVIVGLALLSCVGARAQGGVPLTTVVTDKSPLNLSSRFGFPQIAGPDQAGDFAAIGDSGSALYVRKAGAGVLTQLLQVGDAVPGIANSKIANFTNAVAGSSVAGILFFGVRYGSSDGLPHSALLTWSIGAGTYTVVATDSATAPGSGGLPYGIAFTPVACNDNGDLAFTATPAPNDVTLYMIPAGGAAVRIVGPGDKAPTPSTGSIVTISTANVTLNNSGTMLFSATISNLGGTSLFAANKNGTVTAVAVVGQAQSVVGGGCSTTTGGSIASLFLGSGQVLLNNSNVAIFGENSTAGGSGICYETIGSAPAAAAQSSEAAPAPFAGSLAGLNGQQYWLDGSGDIFFNAEIIGGTTTDELLRFDGSTHTLVVIARVGQTEPSGTGKTYSAFNSFSPADDGTITFLGSFTQGGNGLYQQTRAGVTSLLAMDGQAAGVSGGGVLSLAFAGLYMLNNHAVFLQTQITGGTAYAADLLVTPGTPATITSLMSTGDTLPAGAHTRILGGVRTAGNYVGFEAQEAGGQISLFVANLSTSTITKIATEGDSAPTTGGVVYDFVSFFVNSNGQLLFEAGVLNGSTDEALFIGSPSSSLVKVVADGDVLTANGFPATVESFSTTSVLSAINASGAVAFFASLGNGTIGFPTSAIFRYNANGTFTPIVYQGEAGPSGGTFTFNNSFALNAAGQVVFTGTAAKAGAYAGDGTATPQPVALSGDNVGGSPLSNVNQISGFSDGGVLTFVGSRSSGGSPIVAHNTAPDSTAPVLVEGTGTPTPFGGTYTLGNSVTASGGTITFSPNVAASNDENDVVFRSAITGGVTNSGYFLSPGTGVNAGVVQAAVVQGQAAPGGGTFNSIQFPNFNGTTFDLGPDGEFLFANGVTNNGVSNYGLYLVRQNNSIQKVLAGGDTAPGGGQVVGINLLLNGSAGGAGIFVFSANMVGGTVQQAIFATNVVAGTTSTSTVLSSTRNPVETGASVKFTAIVGGAATGTVTFFDGGVPIGSGALDGSAQATLTTSTLTSGTHSITAQYSGDSNFAPSTSTPLVQAVNSGNTGGGEYDGGGQADSAVFRPSNGTWYVLSSKNPGTAIVQQWGTVGDITVRGDFDGDGVDDFAVFRPSNGTWYVIPSNNPGSPIVQAWGTNGDIPVPGDYDGDGKTDFAVFRPSNGVWYIVPSSNPGSPIVQAWGTNGDIPVPGDYDGDGKTDFAVFRPSNGTWYVIPSGNPGSPIVQAWGTNGDIPVPGDYDGDRKTDFGVFRPSNGTWYIVPTSNPGTPIVQAWGTNGDVPVPADYDADGKTDIAVWRSSNGAWYVLPSTTPGTATVTLWGAGGDAPLERPVGQ